ncbi:MAG: ABC transporter ATP-binding protein [Chloroflexi bacterium]|nr:ABC transporter ATP-binding protein [Chloroflexota bacterium]MBV9896354.1 ABC transporter ATP-binding protein [Chloroflexota bacterium]
MLVGPAAGADPNLRHLHTIVHCVQSAARAQTGSLCSVLGRPAVQTSPRLIERQAPTGDIALVFEGVAKTFPDGTRALEDINVQVHSGEMVAIVGPSGCGKSTLLRLASNLSSPSEGEIRVGDGNLGYVFQDPTLLPWRNVQRNVELLAELAGVPRAERAKLAADAIGLTGLDGFQQHLPRALSGGMRMRVSLARSLTMRPRIFLFDEPFGALDEITRERLNGELLGLFERERFAGLFVTHSVIEATFMASRVLVMSPRPGRIVSEIQVPFGYPRPTELRFDPDFAAVAGQISARLRGFSTE